MRPLACETRLEIAELRDFDLQLTFQRARALREDIENELAAIDYPELEFLLEIARLRGRQRVVKDADRTVGHPPPFPYFPPLPLPHKYPYPPTSNSLTHRPFHPR